MVDRSTLLVPTPSDQFCDGITYGKSVTAPAACTEFMPGAPDSKVSSTLIDCRITRRKTSQYSDTGLSS